MTDLSDRETLLASLVADGVFSVSEAGVPSIADKDSVASVWIANAIMAHIGARQPRPKLSGQVAGSLFEQRVGDFVAKVFPQLALVRCGEFKIDRNRPVSDFDQYQHLADIARLAETVGSDSDRREIKIAFGMEYIIKPDVVIFRTPTPKAMIGSGAAIRNAGAASRSSLLEENKVKPTLHASVSCKLTLRSDRAQNARSEALNLIRNRKGKLPHIALVTAEPTAGRISSLALGTGDIDCVYHIALPELLEATERYTRSAKGGALKGAASSFELLETLVEGRRLRDIADLPFDLAI